jgi:hypothetical protein
MTIDIPGAFMHINIDELIHVHLEGPMAELLARVDPEKYRTYMSKENEKVGYMLNYKRPYMERYRLHCYSGKISVNS